MRLSRPTIQLPKREDWTIAGFRQSNKSSNRILAKDWGGGFLGKVTAVAGKSYQRADWARHWLDAAGKAHDSIEFWRFSKLAEGVVDVRFTSLFRECQ